MRVEGRLLAQAQGLLLEVARPKDVTAGVEALNPPPAPAAAMPYGPAKRADDGTFASVEHADDPWTVFPVSMRCSLKRRLAAHAASKGMKGAEWARIVLEAAAQADKP